MPNASFPIANDHNEGKMVNCVFCKKEHYSAACERVASVAAHKDALLKEGRCFLCLATGHRASQCLSLRKCRKCGRRHHQAICNPPPPRNTTPSEGTLPNNTTTATIGRERYCYKLLGLLLIPIVMIKYQCKFFWTMEANGLI